MKKLEVPFLPAAHRNPSIGEVSEQLNKLQKNAIDIAPWPAYDYKPSVTFTVAHNNDCLFIKYFVQEDAIRAVYRKTNDPVYRDSCVEFFIGFGDEAGYYNLEFNSLGTCMFGFGPEKNNRTLIPEAVSRKIKRRAALSIAPVSGAAGAVSWELSLQIPTRAFCFHQISSFHGQACRVNFYKCGDDLPAPHFLSWTPIESPEPDFHLPQFFGTLQFN
jgi:hypothetical protein